MEVDYDKESEEIKVVGKHSSIELKKSKSEPKEEKKEEEKKD